MAVEIAVPIIVLLVLGLLALKFRNGFLRPARQLESALDLTIEKLESQIQSGIAKTRPRSLEQCFDGDRALKHAWQQYEETLHQPRLIDSGNGEALSSEARSTLPSEIFFSTGSVVDSQVRTEFFKHLPGILTGIGIIGTFLGLILGLWQFRVTDNPQDATNSLSALLRSVGFAFGGSLFAIVFAMLTTYFEKRRLSELYIKVEHIQKILDETFRAGVGEEYLARLVAASEESSSQTRILKDALVTDLKQILTDLTEKQIQASTQSTARLPNAQ